MVSWTTRIRHLSTIGCSCVYVYLHFLTSSVSVQAQCTGSWCVLCSWATLPDLSCRSCRAQTVFITVRQLWRLYLILRRLLLSCDASEITRGTDLNSLSASLSENGIFFVLIRMESKRAIIRFQGPQTTIKKRMDDHCARVALQEHLKVVYVESTSRFPRTEFHLQQDTKQKLLHTISLLESVFYFQTKTERSSYCACAVGII